jgi:hypothetical protein
MRVHGEPARERAAADRRTERPGSRPARLSEACKQLTILLEEVDLEAEPELAEAVVDAVSALARASDLVDGEETWDRRTGDAEGVRSLGPGSHPRDGTSPEPDEAGFAWQAEAE